MEAGPMPPRPKRVIPRFMRPAHDAGRKNIGFEEALAERLAEAAGQIPAGRVAIPGEYGPMGAFLASDKAGHIAGSMIRVDGGRIREMV
jgi:3-oxoacyl-[acyl-carrier protein] reductase